MSSLLRDLWRDPIVRDELTSVALFLAIVIAASLAFVALVLA